MLFIHHASCISPQHTFPDPDINGLIEYADNKLQVIEPSYAGIPPGVLRRMSKAVRIGIGAALPLIQYEPDGIITGTVYGGMEDSMKFLAQMMQYEEGMLTPVNFVQSTANAIASQLGIMTANKGYNITHVHRGLAFENAVIDAMLAVQEQPGTKWLLGCVDELSLYNYNIEYLGGWYKKELLSNKDLYASQSTGSIAGEGAAMFLVSGKPENALAKISAIQLLHTKDKTVVQQEIQQFLATRLPPGERVDILLTGENGDSSTLDYYTACEAVAGPHAAIMRFKHMCGEFPTAAGMALWLVCQLLANRSLPAHMVKRHTAPCGFNRVLIYNNYKGLQHSFMLVERVAAPGRS